MEIKAIQFDEKSTKNQNELFVFQTKGVAINYGTVFLKKGIRIPEKGFTKHPQHEISYIQSGMIQTLNPDGTSGEILKEGDVVSVLALEPQAGIVMSDTKIIYVLIG